MTSQYEQSSINLNPETGYKSYIFDPNAPQSDISFSSWPTLLTTLQRLPGVKEILIPQAPPAVTIPAGTYDMTDIIIAGEGPLTVIDITDVQFQNLSQMRMLSASVGAAVANTVPSFVFNDGAVHVFACDQVNFSVGALAAVPIFDISAGSTLGVTAFQSSFTSANPAVPVIDIDATATFINQNQAGVQGNSWGGASGSNPFVVVALGGDCTINLTTGDIFWFTDNPTVTAINYADDYEEAVLANWGGTAPLNVKNALDRIAAALGPIP